MKTRIDQYMITHEAEMPAKEIAGNIKADAVKAVYNKGKKSNRA